MVVRSADHKWFARLCASAILAHTLMTIKPQYPNVDADHKRQLEEAKAELVAEAPKGAPADPFKAALEAKAAKKKERARETGVAKEPSAAK